MYLEKTLEELVKKELDTIDKSPFTEDGFDLYIQNITSYSTMLYRVSKYYSDKQGVKVISDSHIAKASDTIYKSVDSKFLNFIISLGGIFFGTSISMLVTLTTSDIAISTSSMIIMLSTGILGAFLLGYYLFK